MAPNTKRWCVSALAVVIAAGILGTQISAASAAETGSGKGDYAKNKLPRAKQSVVPKSIYLTPKNDRLPSPNIELYLEPSEPAASEPTIDDDALPQISIPFDPHAVQPGQVGSPVPRTKPPIEIHGRPIDIAFQKGHLVLNRFHTLKVEMLHKECRNFPDFVTKDYELPSRTITTLADNMRIVQKRICAENGSVMVTCYLNVATISLRRARPDDGCRQ